MDTNSKLPKNWKHCPFIEIAKFIDYRGKTPTKTIEGIQLITAKNVRMGTLSSDPKEYISERDFNSWMTRGIPQKGDVLFTTEAPLGNAAILDTDEKRAFAQRLITFQPKKGEYLSKFLFYYLLSPSFQYELDSKATGTTVKGIKASILKNFLIPLPPPTEQTRIVSKLDALFERIDKAVALLEANIKKTGELMGAVLGEVFGELRKTCELKKLDEVALVARGKSKHRPRNEASLFNGQYPFVQTGDIRNAKKYVKSYSQTYNEKGLAQSKLWKKGTICLTIAANIGDVAILGIDACFPDSVVGILSKKCENEFLYYYLITLQTLLDSQANAAAQKNVNLKILETIQVPLPPIDVQKKTVAYLVNIEERTEKLLESQTQKLHHLQALKSSLLDQAFRGEL